MGFDWGGFAGGIAKTWDGKATGEAINQGRLNAKVKKAEDELAYSKKFAEDVKKNGIRRNNDGGEPNAKTQAVPTAEEKKQALDQDRLWAETQLANADVAHETAIKDAYLTHKSPEAYEKYKTSRNARETSDIDLDNKKYAQQVWNSMADGSWVNTAGAQDMLNNAAATMESYTGTNFGKFEIRDGKVYNDTGRGFVELPEQALAQVKRAVAAEMIGTKTGDWAATKAMLADLTSQENMGNAKSELDLKSRKTAIDAQKANAYMNYMNNGGAGKRTSAIGPMSAQDQKRYAEMGFIQRVGQDGIVYMVSPDGSQAVSTGFPAVGRTAIPATGQKNYSGKGGN